MGRSTRDLAPPPESVHHPGIDNSSGKSHFCGLTFNRLVESATAVVGIPRVLVCKRRVVSF